MEPDYFVSAQGYPLLNRRKYGERRSHLCSVSPKDQKNLLNAIIKAGGGHSPAKPTVTNIRYNNL